MTASFNSLTIATEKKLPVFTTKQAVTLGIFLQLIDYYANYLKTQNPQNP